MQLWGYVKGRDLCGARGGHGEGEEGKGRKSYYMASFDAKFIPPKSIYDCSNSLITS